MNFPPATVTSPCANALEPPALIEPAAPDYPDIARQQGAAGTTRVLLTIGIAGRVTSAAIERSSSNFALDRSAMKAAIQSLFKPAFCGDVATVGDPAWTGRYHRITPDGRLMAP